MDGVSFAAFSNELSKEAGIRDLWQGFLDVFRSQKAKADRRVDYHFSPKAGPDRWNKFTRNVRSPDFLTRLEQHPEADPKLIQHARSMNALSHGRTMGVINSARLPGRTYEVKKLGNGSMGCTCNDWRFKGSVSPGYQCKHIRAYRVGSVNPE